MSRETDWRSICVRADPEFNRKSRITPEYKFTAPGKRYGPDGDHPMATEDDIAENAGQRVFYADYQERGPYGDD